MADLFADILEALKGAAGVAAGVNQITTRPTTTIRSAPPLSPSPFETRQNQLAEAITLANLNKAGFNARFSPTGNFLLSERSLTPEEQTGKLLKNALQNKILQQLFSSPNALERQGEDISGTLNARFASGLTGRQGINRAGLVNAIRSRMTGQGGGLRLNAINAASSPVTGSGATDSDGFSAMVPSFGGDIGATPTSKISSSSGGSGLLSNLGTALSAVGAGKTAFDLIGRFMDSGAAGGGNGVSNIPSLPGAGSFLSSGGGEATAGLLSNFTPAEIDAMFAGDLAGIGAGAAGAESTGGLGLGLGSFTGPLVGIGAALGPILGGLFAHSGQTAKDVASERRMGLSVQKDIESAIAAGRPPSAEDLRFMGYVGFDDNGGAVNALDAAIQKAVKMLNSGTQLQFGKSPEHRNLDHYIVPIELQKTNAFNPGGKNKSQFIGDKFSMNVAVPINALVRGDNGIWEALYDQQERAREISDQSERYRRRGEDD